MNILVTAGPTREPLDPVRYLTNRSSGKMGYALANAGAQLGHRVTLVSGPTSLDIPINVDYIPVETAQEMFEAVSIHLAEQDAAIFSAAVADYRPAAFASLLVILNMLLPDPSACVNHHSASTPTIVAAAGSG